MEQLFHQHLLVKAWINNPPKSEEFLNEWIKKLVKAIDMKICMEPRSIYLNVEGNRGITGQAVIETSHICIHIWDECEPAVAQMDVYSCKKFSPQTVLDAMAEFDMIKFESMLIDRNNGLVVVE